MGSWGKTPSPPNDPKAPSAVGNEGELILDLGGETTTYLVQSARLKERSLVVEGEAAADGVPDFILNIDLPEGAFQEDAFGETKGSTLAIQPSSQIRDQAGDKLPISGKVTIVQLTGQGPWEIDAQVEIRKSDEAFSGTLKARVRD